MLREIALSTLISCAGTAPLVAQILPGHSIAAVTVRGVGGEMYDIDHTAGTATQLTLSAALAAEQPNCVLMVDPVNGLVGTNPTAGTANVYRILVQGGSVTETLLNTTAAAGTNIAQLDILGNRVWFCSAGGAAGILQSIPLAGGPVSVELDLATLGAAGSANALCAANNRIYVATFNSSPANTAPTPGELIEYDPTTQVGRLVMLLPAGGFQPNGNPWNTGIVNMRPDPLAPNTLVLQGVYGELLRIDPIAGQVVDQVWTGVHNATGNALASGSVNSFDWDPVAGDWIVGTRDGHIERWVHAGQAEKQIPGVGSGATPTDNSVAGIDYVEGLGGVDQSYGPGCRGNGEWFPTDSSFGAPFAGNSAFRFGLFGANGGDPVALLVDFQNATIGSFPLPLDLTFLGAPSCFLRTGNVVAVPTTATGSGPGEGQAVVPFAIPTGTSGATIYRQWVELQVTPTNTLGAVLSNARRLVVP